MGSRAHGTWARVYADVWDHPKTAAVARALEAIGVPARWSSDVAVGQLHRMACRLADTTDDGRLGHLAPQAFCRLIGWTDHRKADAVLAAWMASGFIDSPGTDDAKLHGFEEMFHLLIKKRDIKRKERERMRCSKNGDRGIRQGYTPVSTSSLLREMRDESIPSGYPPKVPRSDLALVPASPDPSPVTETRGPGFGPDDLARLYLEALPALPKVRVPLTKRLRQVAAAALREEPKPDIWRERMARVASSLFLNGENDRGWRACFAWLLNRTNAAKIDAGAYDRGKPTVRKSASMSQADAAIESFSVGVNPNGLDVLPESTEGALPW